MGGQCSPVRQQLVVHFGWLRPVGRKGEEGRARGEGLLTELARGHLLAARSASCSCKEQDTDNRRFSRRTLCLAMYVFPAKLFCPLESWSCLDGGAGVPHLRTRPF